MIEDGLSYPMREEWTGRILIGTVLTFLGFLLIPVILLSGYYLRVMGATARGADEPPAFSDWGGLFVDGLKAAVVGFVYAIVPTVVWFVVVSAVLGVSLGVGGEGAAAFGFAAMLLSMLAFVPLVFLLLYILPAAFTNMAAEGRIGAAFDFGTLKTAWTSGDYLVAVVLAFAVSIGLGIVINVLAITIVGLVLVPTLGFYSNLVVSRICARGFAKASESRTGEPAATVPTA